MSIATKLSRPSKKHKTKQAIIDEVVQAVLEEQKLVVGGAAERDERRRRARMDELRTFNDVRITRKTLALVAATVGDEFEDMKEQVLLHE